MRRVSAALGLSLLYASFYYLPLLERRAFYFIPDFFQFLILPSLVSVLVLTPLFFIIGSAKFSPRVRAAVLFGGAFVMTAMAVKCVLDAAGYPWMALLQRVLHAYFNESTEAVRLARRIVVAIWLAAILIVLFLARRRLVRCLRFLSILGYAFFLLALCRCLSGELGVHLNAPVAVAIGAPQVQAPAAPRRVVWVIFDEMDYRLGLGAGSPLLPNINHLAERAVSATAAYSPGRDTSYSIPALLTGTSIEGFARTAGGNLQLSRVGGGKVVLDTEHSVFAQIPGGAASATVLGFYHPYCRLFPALRACHSSYHGNAGRWFDSLVFFGDNALGASRNMRIPEQVMPEWILMAFDPMYRASTASLARLDAVLADKAGVLDFIHLNFPHLPNSYAAHVLKRNEVIGDDAYKTNMMYADLVLGKIVSTLAAQSGEQEILLIVSSDHWYRESSKAPAPVPFIAWRVGAGREQARSLTAPLSTVHSAALASGFLNGRLSSQSDLADFLQSRPFAPTWMAPVDYRE